MEEKVYGKIFLKEKFPKKNGEIKGIIKFIQGGDSTKSGNPNLRVIEENDQYFLMVNLGLRNKNPRYPLFVPKKYLNDFLLLINKPETKYNVRLMRKTKNIFKVNIDYEIQVPKVAHNFSRGVIGVDANPLRYALSWVSEDGNLIKTKTLTNNRLFFASTEKRNYELGCLVKEITSLALEDKVGIVFENLNFYKDFIDEGRKFNRVKSNFIWRKFLSLLEVKCIEYGIPYRKVNPAFTSLIGKFKYMKLYNLTTHESASFVIARRGLGLKEILSLYKYPKRLLKSIMFNNLEWKKEQKWFHSWSLWRKLRDNYGSVLRELQSGMSKDVRNLDDYGCTGGEIPPDLILGYNWSPG